MEAMAEQSKIHVSALVFYGRRQYVRVLDGYIKRNLASVGGLLEEVSLEFAICVGKLTKA